MKKKTLVEKLHPERFPNMSAKMAAIVGYILGIRYTNPALVGMISTEDGGVLGMHEGDVGFNDFIGAKADLERNWNGLLDVAGLTPKQRKQANSAFKDRVHLGPL